MSKKDFILIQIVVVVAIIFGLTLSHLTSIRQDALNHYDDCVQENNKGRLPAEKAWEVYSDICVQVRNDTQN